ncbi:MAG: aspartyl/glutamyl-tRNA(Asn/Gln) amidotransferase subunit B [Candidatus Poribacteria bacterium]|nr:MAG: aspartyl/glutamyl-tRNA(Asn/Gln) amidotransferase subunit B [Candidatus Poribacteria bacterium]
MEFEVVIGLEIHAELKTRGKLFTWTANEFGGEPNTRIDVITLGMPGVLPVLNRKAVDYTLAAGLAMNCKINRYSRFDRKHYFYPDLPKGYQISQKDYPLCYDGWIEFDVNGEVRRCRINRIHLEEDAGKSIHAEGRDDVTWVDFNRCGVPLIEIVSEPDLRSPEEAIAYWRAVKEILEYLDVSDCNMEEGSFRCDANISLRPRGSQEFGIRTELKNMNSFRFVQQALEYEVKRQAEILRSGGQVVQETRLFDVERGVTRGMRGKEEASDYRYFPEPDLVPIEIDEEWIERIRRSLPELPRAKRLRFMEQYGLPEQDVIVLTGTRALADYYEAVAQSCGDPKAAANWVMGDLIGFLREAGRSIEDSPVGPEALAEMIRMIQDGTISGRIAKEVLEQMVATGKSATQIVEEKGLRQISDVTQIEAWIDQVIAENPAQVEQYRSGKTKVLGYFVGQVMRLSRGKANPQQVNALLRKKLDQQ